MARDEQMRWDRKRSLTPRYPYGRRIRGHGGCRDHHSRRVLWRHVPGWQTSVRNDRCCKETRTCETGTCRRAHVQMARTCTTAARTWHGDDLAPCGCGTRGGSRPALNMPETAPAHVATASRVAKEFWRWGWRPNDNAHVPLAWNPTWMRDTLNLERQAYHGSAVNGNDALGPYRPRISPLARPSHQPCHPLRTPLPHPALTCPY